MNEKPSKNVSYNIINNLYMGNLSCCQEFKQIMKEREPKIIHLEETEFNRELSCRTRSRYKKNIVPYFYDKDNLYFDFHDSSIYTKKQLMYVLDVSTRFYRWCKEESSHSPVLVHCLAGINRTPFVTCGIMLKTRMIDTIEEFKSLMKFPYIDGGNEQWFPQYRWLEVLKSLEKGV